MIAYLIIFNLNITCIHNNYQYYCQRLNKINNVCKKYFTVLTKREHNKSSKIIFKKWMLFFLFLIVFVWLVFCGFFFKVWIVRSFSFNWRIVLLSVTSIRLEEYLLYKLETNMIKRHRAPEDPPITKNMILFLLFSTTWKEIDQKQFAWNICTQRVESVKCVIKIPKFYKQIDNKVEPFTRNNTLIIK